MPQRFKLLLFTIRSLSLIILLSCIGCQNRNKNGTSEKPAEVVNQVKENTLTTVRLTPEAEKRLGIETRSVEIKNVPKSIKTGGEIIAPPGQDVKVTAPVAGTVVRSEKGYFPVAGSYVQKDQEIMRLILLPPEVDIISAREEVNVRQMEYDVVLKEAKRAEQLLANKAISEKVYEATEARLARAEASLNAAKGRLNLYQGTESDSASKYLSTIKIGSPINGIIQNVNVTPQQTINASTIMFEVSPVNRFWIRVPVYSGDIEEVDRSHGVSVSTMGNEAGNGSFFAEPVQGPQVGDASSASSYMFYEVENKSGRLRAGQKVSVALILKSTSQSLAVPYSSIIYDMYGGNWVYVRIEPRLYMRKRVELDHITDTLAIISRGVNQGDEVVFNGAAELYGTEFGGGK